MVQTCQNPILSILSIFMGCKGFISTSIFIFAGQKLIWRFPKIGLPPSHHPFIAGFSTINHPGISRGSPMTMDKSRWDDEVIIQASSIWVHQRLGFPEEVRQGAEELHRPGAIRQHPTGVAFSWAYGTSTGCFLWKKIWKLGRHKKNQTLWASKGDIMFNQSIFEASKFENKGHPQSRFSKQQKPEGIVPHLQKPVTSLIW